MKCLHVILILFALVVVPYQMFGLERQLAVIEAKLETAPPAKRAGYQKQINAIKAKLGRAPERAPAPPSKEELPYYETKQPARGGENLDALVEEVANLMYEVAHSARGTEYQKRLARVFSKAADALRLSE